MKALILAAGLGKRMRPLTWTRSKASLPLFNRPFILHALDYLRRSGIQEIAINLHHAPSSITSLLEEESSLDIKIRYSYEEKLLGTAGAMKKLKDFFGSETFLVMNCDFVSDINLGEVLAYHKKERPMATLVLKKADARPYSKVKVGKKSQIEAIGVQEAHHIFCGLHIVEPDIFPYIPEEKYADIIKDIYSSLIDKGVILKAYEHRGFWFEFGDLKQYFYGHMELAHQGERFLNQMIHTSFSDHRKREGSSKESKMSFPDHLFVGKDFRSSLRSTIHGYFIAGERCLLGEDTTIKDSILHRKVVISPGASLSKCIVGEKVTIPEGMELYGSAITLMPEGQNVSEDEGMKEEGSLLIKRFLD